MGYIEIIILIWTVGTFAASALYFIWKGYRRAKQDGYSSSPNDNRRLIRKVLRTLNCKPVWKKENEDSLVDYQYQDGSFRIRLNKNSPFVRLSCLSFYSVLSEQLELMRNICNQCNQNTDNCRLVYTIDNANGTAQVHIVSGLLLNDMTSALLLKRTMEDMFLWKNVFVKRFEEMAKDAEVMGMADIERAGMEIGRNIYLVHEQEMLHQDGGLGWREQPDSGITIRKLFAAALGVSQFLPIRMTVLTDDRDIRKVETADISDMELSAELIADGKFVHQTAVLFLSYFDRIMPEKERRLVVYLSAEQGDEHTLYYRITVTRLPLSVQKANPVGSDNNKTKVLSVLAAHDLRPSQTRTDEFRYLWKEAMAKFQREGAGTLTDEERLLIACVNPQMGYYLYRGKTLFNRKCFLDAVVYLEYVYHTLQQHLPYQQLETQQYFFEASYMIGYCYNALHQYDRAYYYLELLLPLHNIVYTEEYINCMVNGGDLRAYGIIEGLLQELANLPEKERAKSYFAPFMNFLKRRKAYVLVERRSYEEAEKLLRKMIDEPDNADFAIHELAYIQKKKEAKQ